MFLAAAPTGVLTAGPTLKQIYGKGVAYLWKNEGVAPLRELLYIAHFANSPLGHISSTPVCRLQCIGSVSAWVGAGNGSFKREASKYFYNCRVGVVILSLEMAFTPPDIPILIFPLNRIFGATETALCK